MFRMLTHAFQRPLVGLLIATFALGCATTVHATGAQLPPGYLSTRGAQIVDSEGIPVRIAAIGWNGADSAGNVPLGLQFIGYKATMRQMVAAGFNTVRIALNDRVLTELPRRDAINPRHNPDLVGLTAVQVLDRIVAYAGRIGLRVILDHHNNEGGLGPHRVGGQQGNGLWFDRGPGSTNEDMGDGTGNPGTVTAADFLRNWVALARRYAGDATVIGFDLHNEPSPGPKGNGINWGEGGPTDVHAMCTAVGSAIQAVNSGPLIICPAFQDYAGGMPEGDLRGVAAKPVVLPVTNKVVYTVHSFPGEISGVSADSGPAAIARMNRAWGYLITNDIAPVFVGQMGSSMLTKQSRAWARTLLDYMEGVAEGGPRFSGDQQPVSGGWWVWGSWPGHVPQGVLHSGWDPRTNGLDSEQREAWKRLLYTPSPRVPRTVAPTPVSAARGARPG
ncbi:MAG: glycoside hydrolase family 5 protein [Acetobacteraceae bacterium]